MERDDLIANESYALNAKHSEEEGKVIRKKLYTVTIILAVLTAIEIMMGIYFKRNGTFLWETIKLTFIVLTLVKAAYIVMVFMHMGNERKGFQYIILLPYFVFMLFLIFLGILEGIGINASHTIFG